MEWIVEWRTQWATPIFKFLTFLGDEEFFLAALPLLYWFWNKATAYRLGAIILFTGMLNAFLKGWIAEPRPPRELHLVVASSYAFPSGHSQLGAATWLWLAHEIDRRWFWPLAVLLAVGIATSRVYLGVHWPVDIVAGLAVGAATVYVFRKLVEADPDWWRTAPVLVPAAALTLAQLVWLATFAEDVDDGAAKVGGALVGMTLGVMQARRSLGFRCGTGPVELGLQIGIGLGVLVGIWIGLKPVLMALGFSGGGTMEALGGWLRYCLMGWWVAFGAPWLFVRLRWATAEPAPYGATPPAILMPRIRP